MDALYTDDVDVEWSVTQLGDDPVLVVQTTGPVTSATFLSLNPRTLKLRYIYDQDRFPSLVPTTFVCYEDITKPILACELDDIQHPLIRVEQEKKPWLLLLQFVVEGMPQSRVFRTLDGVTHPVTDGITEVLPRWVCQIR